MAAKQPYAKGGSLSLDAELGVPLPADNELLLVGVGRGGSVRLEAGGKGREATPGEDGGFRLGLDSSDWSRGDHPFSLELRDGAGARLAWLDGLADVQPFRPPPGDPEAVLEAVAEGRPAMWCDFPELGSADVQRAPLEVRGWAIDPAGVRRVLVTIDSRRRLIALHGLPRTDLRAPFGDRLAADAGFSLRLDPEELPPGRHRLSVIAVGGNGKALGMSGEVEVQAPLSTPTPASRSRFEPMPAQPLPSPAGSCADGGAWAEYERYGLYAALAPQAAGVRVLDLECGSGWGTALLAGRAAAAFGIDRSPRAVEEAGHRWSGPSEFRRGEPGRLPCAEGEFDLVVCLGALDREPDPERGLDEIHRVLRPGGLLALGSGAGAVPGEGIFARRPHDRERLSAALRARFAAVAVKRPTVLLAVGLGGEEGGEEVTANGAVRLRHPAGEHGEHRAWLALASDGALPAALGPALLDTAAVEGERRRLTEMWRERAVLGEVRMATLRTETFYVGSSQRRTIERAAAAAREAEAEIAGLRAEQARIVGSTWWRLGQTLRALLRRFGIRG